MSDPTAATSAPLPAAINPSPAPTGQLLTHVAGAYLVGPDELRRAAANLHVLRAHGLRDKTGLDVSPRKRVTARE